MSKTTQSRWAGPFVEFHVDTEMKDVEILRVTSDRMLAKGKRFGRIWLLRGLPPEKKNDPGMQRQLREEFDRRFARLDPQLPLTVGMEEIEGLGPCIVEEWREDQATEESENTPQKPRRNLRRPVMLMGALILIAGVAGTGIHINRLTERSETVNAHLSALQEANRQGEAQIQALADSLDKVVSDSLLTEKFAYNAETDHEDKEERMANALYQARIREFRQELVRYDREVVPELIEDRPVFLDSICVLYRSMLRKGADADPHGIFPQLPEDDRIRLTSRLYGGYMLSLGDYSRIWMPKAWAAYKRQQEEKESAKKEETK